MKITFLLTVRIVILSIMLSLWISSCTTSDSLSPLTEIETCQPIYCWQGLSWDASNYDDFENRVKMISDFKPVAAQEQKVINGSQVTEYTWSSKNETSDYSQFIILLLEDGKPTSLTRAFSGISLNKIIEYFGEPSRILIYEAGPPSHVLISITLIYDPQGMIFFSEYVSNQNPDPFKAKITPKIKFWAYMLSSSPGFKDLMYTQLLNGEWRSDEEFNTRIEEQNNQTQIWTGYGVYEITPIY